MNLETPRPLRSQLRGDNVTRYLISTDREHAGKFRRVSFLFLFSARLSRACSLSRVPFSFSLYSLAPISRPSRVNEKDR